MRIIGLLAVLLLLNGCFLFRPAEKTDNGVLYTERVSRPRTERQLERKELVLAVHDSIESSWEITQLRQVLEIVSSCGANVVTVYQDRQDTTIPITSCFMRINLETRDFEQIELIKSELAKAGFSLM